MKLQVYEAHVSKMTELQLRRMLVMTTKAKQKLTDIFTPAIIDVTSSTDFEVRFFSNN